MLNVEKYPNNILQYAYIEVQLDRVCRCLLIRESKLFLEELHHLGIHCTLKELQKNMEE